MRYAGTSGQKPSSRTPAHLAFAALALALWLACAPPPVVYADDAPPPADPSTPTSTTPTPTVEPTATPSPQTVVVGRSVRGRAITLVRFGQGERRILVIGGLHGNEAGAPVARAFAAYLSANPSAIPTGTEIDVLAVANPDGYAKRTRGNANRIDLNRNFASRDWRRLHFGKLTSGKHAGSQPETKAVSRLLERGYLRVVSLHSKGGFTDGGGRGGVTLARKVAKAAGIKRVKMSRFGRYPGSLGSYCPERYPAAAYVVWELSSRKLTARVRAGLLAAIR
ncbi:MAG TPA: DUF2817 domain-containing protein [Coriobacteriia bacterium]|nr:DUF2817 domain-containing protein [Coriobacteriia bacterium]